MNPMYDKYYMNPKALVRDKESGASAKVHAKPKRKGGSVKPGKKIPVYTKGGERVPGMFKTPGNSTYQAGGMIPGMGAAKKAKKK